MITIIVVSGKSGLLYTLLFCLIPCVPILLARQEARERYNIEVMPQMMMISMIMLMFQGSTMDDAVTSFCCTSCVMCQTAAEIKNRGDGE